MNKKERIIWSVVLMTVLALSGFLYYQNLTLEKELSAMNGLRIGLLKENYNLKNSIDQLDKKSEEDQELSKWALVDLKKAGLADPVKDIKADLMLHPELIPYEGILGGRMGFYSENGIRIINHWVFAYFEDGHIGGYMVLEYKVAQGGRISWKVLYSHLEYGE
ncbi:MAG: hypothetical protein JXN63_08730 [Candidatus Delongbacteria bacterium]|nr:hypothetical protein [Candidatus Delongbacteria bacterium]